MVSANLEPSNSNRRPAFVIGVSGNMDPVLDHGGEEKLRERFASIFSFFRGGDESELKGGSKAVEELLGAGLESAGLDKWRGLGKDTSIILLTSLAPGVDQIAAKVAFEMGIELRCPLPYPVDLYAVCSTFTSVFPGASEKELRAKFDKVLEDLGRPQTFQAYLSEDIDDEPDGLNPSLGKKGLEDLHASMLKELVAKKGTMRNKRYRASGEYVAGFSDVLVAVCDAEDAPPNDYRESPGTLGIIEASREGVTPGLLPLTSSFTWADNGPTFHLHHPRHKQNKGRLNEEETRRNGRLLRVLYPYDIRAEGVVKDERRWIWPDPEESNKCSLWAEAGGYTYCRIVEHLRRCNEDFQGKECSGALENDIGGSFEKNEAGGEEAWAHAESLRHISEMRRTAGDGETRDGENAGFDSGTLRHRNNRLFASLIWLAFFSAVFLHLFAHWHPQGGGEEQGALHGEEHEGVFGLGVGAHGENLRFIFGLLGLGAAFSGLLFLRKHKLSAVEPRVLDYRALAEGLRIQFYWCVAGLRRSVAANYLQRQRGELDWLRTAMSSLSFPYERWQERFFDLPHRSQFLLFERVNEKWFTGQLRYFSGGAEKRRHELHGAHRAGASLAITGLLHVLLVFFLILTPPGHDLVKAPCVPSLIWILGVAGFTVFAVRLGASRSKIEKANDGAPKEGEERCAFYRALDLSHLFGSGHEEKPPLPSETDLRRDEIHKGFLISLSMASVLIWPSVLLCLLLSLIPGAPGPVDWAIVMMGSFLVAGGLTIARAEKSLLSEEAHQFSSMTELFHSAGLRMKELIKRLKNSAEDADSGVKTAVAEFVRAREEVHQLLFAVGKEALDENAEWLILHRSRPLEPVIGA